MRRGAAISDNVLDLDRLKRVFGMETPSWDAAMTSELDQLSAELGKSGR